MKQLSKTIKKLLTKLLTVIIYNTIKTADQEKKFPKQEFHKYILVCLGTQSITAQSIDAEINGKLKPLLPFMHIVNSKTHGAQLLGYTIQKQQIAILTEICFYIKPFIISLLQDSIKNLSHHLLRHIIIQKKFKETEKNLEFFNIYALKKELSPYGRIINRRVKGGTRKQQKIFEKSVKRARHFGLLYYIKDIHK